MLRVLVLLGLATACLASSDGRQFCCSAEDRHIVEEEWKVIWHEPESSKIKTGFGREILTKLANEIEEVKVLFKEVHIEDPTGPDFTAHTMRILNAIDMIITLLDDPDSLDAALDHLADQHHARPGVKKEHFRKMGEILHTALSNVLDDYNAMSWKSCFKGILTKISSKLNA